MGRGTRRTDASAYGRATFGTVVGRPNFVERTRLLDLLLGVPPGRCVCIVAPGGYGKSTLLRQWESADPRAVVRVDLDRDDNDPVALLDHLWHALVTVRDRISPDRDPGTRDAEAPIGVERLLGLLHGVDPGSPLVLLLDHAEVLHTRAARDILTTLVRDSSPGVVLGLASRREPPGGTGRLRSSGALVEVRRRDLALDEHEIDRLLDGLGVERDERLDATLERSEGWPVAVYLSALAATRPADSPSDTVHDAEHFIAEYVDEAILGRVSPGRREFLLGTAILDRLSGPLCDFVLEREASADRLMALEATNLLIESLDGSRDWYRYHPLFADHLRDVLHHADPELVDILHRRAARWFSDNDMPVWAVHHAQEAGDATLAATLVARHARSQFNASRYETVSDWFAWFDDLDPFPSIPGLAETGALAFSWIGDVARAERWASRALAGVGDGRIGPLGRLVRGFGCPADLAHMRDDARTAVAELPADSDWHAAALALDGLGQMLDGDPQAARRSLSSAILHGESYQALMAAATAHALMATLSIEVDDWGDAARHVGHAISDAEAANLEHLVTGCLSFAVAARIETHAGRISVAEGLVRRAAAARAATTDATPIVSAFALQELSRAHLELGDVPGARQAHREATSMLGERGRFGRLDVELDRLAEQLADLPTGAIGASSLTAAEMRLLPHLVTHLTFGEIADRLYVSRHTVKTQAMSIYRKLEVSSRGEAVGRARDLGLLPG